MGQEIQVKRRISISRLVAALALTCLVFGIGILIGSSFTENKIEDINAMQRDLELELTQIDIEDKLAENICVDPTFLVEKLNELGSKLIYLEAQYPKNDPVILDLKEPYTLLEIRHYLRLEKMNELCNNNHTLIIFFYSNTPEYKGEGEKQGFVLDYLRKKYDNIKVYSIDVDLQMSVISTLKEVYNVQSIPSIVINDKIYTGFMDVENITSVIISSSVNKTGQKCQ